jgi:hypothetical protein
VWGAFALGLGSGVGQNPKGLRLNTPIARCYPNRPPLSEAGYSACEPPTYEAAAPACEPFTHEATDFI